MIKSRITSNRLPEAPSQVIHRDRPLNFTFDGKSYTAYEGDTIASALAAAGVKTFSRSFKYHRRRGLLCVAGHCPNCLVQVGDEPNVRACATPVEEGMAVSSQNAWPSLDYDVMSLTQRAERLLPVGFYYKMFKRPQVLWPVYERVLRRAAGLGRLDTESHPHHPEKLYKHTDVAVVGGGPAGLRAAQAAAQTGARVIVLEAEPALGGHLRWSQADPAVGLLESVKALENIEILPDTTVFGCYDDLWIGAAHGDQLVKLRARALVIATGTYEVPALFENNDLPGVMLASGALRLARLWGVSPGVHAVVISSNRRGLHTALELAALGINVIAVAESRAQPDPDLAAQLARAGIQVLPEMTITRAYGRSCVMGAHLGSLNGGAGREVECDLIVTSTGLAPASELLLQAGGTLAWDAHMSALAQFSLPAGVFAAGEVTAAQSLVDIEREGELAGMLAALAAGVGDETVRERAESLAQEVEQARQARDRQVIPPLNPSKHDLVCWCEDVTSKDIEQAIAEGFNSPELLKRYTSIGMGPCQGKLCHVTAMRLCAHHNGQDVTAVGTTTARPPLKPVAMGTLAGRVMEPVRLTPLHSWHLQHGARMMNAGLWKRPEHYGDPVAEVRAVRERVGLIDVSTLGKIQLTGPDVPALLERLYTNRWGTLEAGRVRYGVMVNDEGVVMDDGVTASLGDDVYYMTTTSGGSTQIYEWIEWWLQSGWPFDVQVVNVTEHRAAINLAGPCARQVLAKVVEDSSLLANDSFPYMHVRQMAVAGAPAILMRIGFTGELSYEIHTPSGYGQHVWQALVDAGAEFGILPFGVEAQRVLRLEKGHIIVGQDTDALSSPFEAGMDWAVKLDKDDFLGKPSLRMAQERGAEKRLAGFEMVDGSLPEEMCQIVRPGSGPLGLDIIGRVTSVRRSPTLNKVIGLCWLPADMVGPGQEFSIRVRGQLLTGRVVDLPFYDPEGLRLRG